MTREVAIDNLKADIKYWENTSVSTEHLYMAIKALEQEPCDDAVSRQAVMALLDKGYCHKEPYERKEGNTVYKGYDTYYMINFDKLKALPSVLPKREQGEWIFEEVGVRTQVLKCSKCGTIIQRGENFTQEEFRKYINDILREKCITLDNFCHNCGAEMR